MDEKIREVIVDTYAIISDFSGTITKRAYEIMEGIRTGVIKGIIHTGIVYELILLYLKNRIPFKSIDEVSMFIKGYFQYISPDFDEILLSAQIKVKGDSILSNATDLKLRERRLSFSDAFSIALAISRGVPIISGDADLSYVARKFGANIIW